MGNMRSIISYHSFWISPLPPAFQSLKECLLLRPGCTFTLAPSTSVKFQSRTQLNMQRQKSCIIVSGVMGLLQQYQLRMFSWNAPVSASIQFDPR